MITTTELSGPSNMTGLPAAKSTAYKMRIRFSSAERLLFLISFSALLWSVGYPDLIRFPIYLWLIPIAAIFCRWSTTLLVSLGTTYFWIVLLGLILLIFHDLSSVFWTIVLLGWVCTVYQFVVVRIQFARQPSESLLNAFDQGLVWGLRANLLAILISLWYIGEPLHRGTGFFIEPSHIGYTLGPVLAYLLYKRTKRLEAASSAAALFLVAPSTTFAVAIGLGLLLALCSTRTIYVLLVSAICSTSTGTVQTISAWMLEVKPESTTVLILAYQTAAEQINKNPILGNGPFSWVQGGERDIDYRDLSTLNQRDLASILPFIMASFGWTGIIISLVIIILLLRQAQSDNGLALLITVCILTFVARWAGPVPSALLPLLTVYLAFKRIAK